METDALLALCVQAQWDKANAALNTLIRREPDSPSPYAMAAHLALRRGKPSTARWLVHKAQGLRADHPGARLEDICIDVYEAKFETAYRKLNPDLLAAAPQDHPVHYAAVLLCCLFSDAALYRQWLHGNPWQAFSALISPVEYYLSPESATPRAGKWQAVEEVRSALARGDHFMACLAARFTELLFPGEADSFAALGLFNLAAGNYANADRNFHEAVFRESSHLPLVHLHRFYLFCRQQRFGEALSLAQQIEQAGHLDFTGHGLLLEAMLRAGHSAESVAQRLAQLDPHLRAAGEVNALIESVRLRLALRLGQCTPAQAAAKLAPLTTGKDCPPACLYLFAELIAAGNPAEARRVAARALEADPLHPDAAQWDGSALSTDNFEFAGLFIPRAHEGGAWPTETQTKLLDLLFLTPPEQRAEKWLDFTGQQALQTLEAGAARLLPAFYKSLIDAGETSFAESDLLKGIWKKSYIENALRLKHALGTLGQLRKETGIDPVLLKGIANALPLYGDLGSRPMSDTDALIMPEEMPTAHAWLASRGWHPEYRPEPHRLRFGYGITYRHPEGGMLDLHWKPCEDFSGDDYDPADLGAFDSLELLGERWRTLSPTLAFLCTVLHGVEWNHLPPVRWVADALLLLDRRGNSIDWREMHRLAKKYHCLHVLGSGLQYLRHYRPSLMESLPKATRGLLAEDYRHHTLLRIRLRPRNTLANTEEALAALEHYRTRYRFAARDRLFICGGDAPEFFARECAARGIGWLPHASPEALYRASKQRESIPSCNIAVIDASLSCAISCMQVGYRAAVHSCLTTAA